VAGEITIDMSKVKTFSTDEPIEINTLDGQIYRDRVSASPDGEGIVTAPVQAESAAPADETVEAPAATAGTVGVSSIVSINPYPPEKPRWTGAIVGGIAGSSGNSKDFTASLNANASIRRKDPDDRISLLGNYYFKRQEDVGTGVKTTTEDEWLVKGQYDRFLSEKLYAFFSMTVERDRIAGLDLRLNPAVGVGYQWVERADFNFRTEAGIGYIYDDFRSGDTEETVALRLAYHLDKKLTDRLAMFHNLEYLPSFEDPADFLLKTDVGVRADLTDSFFTQASIAWEHDSQPAPGAKKDDLKYLVGVGWKF
jgi:putative salt-induced outer membrane protein